MAVAAVRLSDARLPVPSEAFPNAYADACDDVSRRGRKQSVSERRRAVGDARDSCGEPCAAAPYAYGEHMIATS